MYNKIKNFKGPYIIAEISGNHDGSLIKAKKLVLGAKKAGAHAIKLQTFLPNEITLNSKSKYFQIKDKGSIWRNAYLIDLYKKAETPWKWHKEIFSYAKKLKLDFFSSVFDEKSLNFLESLNVKFYKISSFENNHYPLIEKIISTKKCIIVSTGASYIKEIDELVNFFKRKKYKNFFLLKCTSNYPTALSEVNLKSINFFRKKYKTDIGISDHTLGFQVPVAATYLGVSIIEKHIKLNNDNKSIDSKFALSIKEFAKMCDKIKEAVEILGIEKPKIGKKENKNRKFKRSIFISQNVSKNQKITLKNIKIVRPSNGLEPKFLKKILGKKFRKNYKFSTPLKLNMIK